MAELGEKPMNLRDPDELKREANKISPDSIISAWQSDVSAFLTSVREADATTLRSADFHALLWDKNPVSGVGSGQVNVDRAIGDPEFRSWIIDELTAPLPGDRNLRLAKIESVFENIKARIKQYSDRTPRAKILRLMAVFFPQFFTSILSLQALTRLHRELFEVTPRASEIRYQYEITERLSEVLGAPDDNAQALAQRMTLAWQLYDRLESKRDESSGIKEDLPGEEKLVPLPANQRRRGLTSISGGLGALINAISFVEAGVTKDDLLDHLRTENPDYRDSSIKTLFNVLKNEFRVIEQDGESIKATVRGQAMLESGEPEELFPTLLTRVLGFDAALHQIQREPGIEYRDVIAYLQKINPGWTTTFAPSALVKWLVDFGLIELSAEKRCTLTGLGQEWAQKITWMPEPLATESKVVELEQVAAGGEFSIQGVDLRSIRAAVNEGAIRFPEAAVTRLHLGLWSDYRRHFAVLAGLSGSGKTLLAIRYGNALSAQMGFGSEAKRHVFVQAVEPGWHDSATLFGYVNPLAKETYVRSAFLDFLLEAARYPAEPFVVVLDEMNLSHPEQYLAPVLSSIESGQPIRLHNEGSPLDGVPPEIPYPQNVAFIGTVNMDETTHGLSDKVLDRAFTLEFWDIDLDQYPGWARTDILPATAKAARACLADLMEALKPVRLHFGWRTVEQVLNYLASAQQSAPELEAGALLDDVVFARILPKLRGTESERLQSAMAALADALKKHGLVRCVDKVSQLRKDLDQTGMMRFWH